MKIKNFFLFSELRIEREFRREQQHLVERNVPADSSGDPCLEGQTPDGFDDPYQRRISSDRVQRALLLARPDLFRQFDRKRGGQRRGLHP